MNQPCGILPPSVLARQWREALHAAAQRETEPWKGEPYRSPPRIALYTLQIRGDVVQTPFVRLRGRTTGPRKNNEWGLPMFTIVRSAWVGVALLALSTASLAQSNPAREVDFDIESQPLVDALNAWARQSRLQLIWPAGNERTRAVAKSIVGRFEPHEALRRLLEGSGLTFSIVDAQTVSIQREPERPPRDAVADARPSTQAAAPETQRDARRSSRSSENISEIVVTGTHVRGASIQSAPLIVMTHEEIRRTGVATVEKLIDLLPQNFGGVREDSAQGNSPIGENTVSFGSSSNLRGLGSDSTLVLLNGRRLAPTGPYGGYVDISTIPIAAVDRIEVLTDGASAIYGSDAVAGVVNFILRDELDGAETSVHYGSVTDGELDHLRVSQLFGTHWDSGNALLIYEYSDRDRLRSDERHFAADSDLTRFGGDNFSVPDSNPGTITRGGQTFAIPSGQDGRNLEPADLLPGTNLQNIRKGVDLLPEQELHALFLSGAQALGSTELFFSGGYAKREFEVDTGSVRRTLSVPASNPFYVNPFGDTANVNVRYDFGADLGSERQAGEIEMYGAMLGAQLDLARTWRADIYGSHDVSNELALITRAVNDVALAAALADPNPATAMNVFGDGSHTNPQTLAAVGSGYVRYSGHSSIDAVRAKADGDLFRLGGGAAKMAAGIDVQRNHLEFDAVEFAGRSLGSELHTAAEREIYSAFAELYLPFIGGSSRKRGIHELAASLAARYDHYSDFGSTTNPKVSLLWKPIESFSVRGTLGTAFKAPLLSQLDGSTAVVTVPLPDVSGTTNTLLLIGTKPNLSPEEATIWTLGLEIAPGQLAGVGIRLDYFNIDIDDRIRLPGVNAFPLLVDPIYASLVTRNPALADVQALYATTGFVPTVPPDQIGAIVDVRTANVARTKLDGVDLRLSYLRGLALGELQFRLNASYVLADEVAITASAPFTDLADTLRHPIDLRLHAMATWTLGDLTTTLTVSYSDSYTDTLSNPNRKIGSWTTANVQLAYALRSEDRWLSGTRIALDVQNVFDADPPFANMRGTGFDAYNTTALGRYASLQIVKRW